MIKSQYFRFWLNDDKVKNRAQDAYDSDQYKDIC